MKPEERNKVANILLRYSTWNERFLKLNQELTEQTKEIESTRENIQSALASAGIPKGTNTGDPTYSKALNIFESLDRIRKYTQNEVKKMLDEKEMVEFALSKLNFNQRRVIELWYFDNTNKRKRFISKCKEIANVMQYSSRHIERLYNQALNNIFNFFYKTEEM